MSVIMTCRILTGANRDRTITYWVLVESVEECDSIVANAGHGVEQTKGYTEQTTLREWQACEELIRVTRDIKYESEMS